MKKITMLLIFVSKVALANGSPFLTAEELSKSKLTGPEKGAAAMTLDTTPVISCISTNESLGADSERLNVYRLDTGLSVVIWKTLSELKVAGSERDVADLTESYKKGKTETFNRVDEALNSPALSLTFGRIIPMTGKLTVVKFVGSSKKAELICKME